MKTFECFSYFILTWTIKNYLANYPAKLIYSNNFLINAKQEWGEKQVLRHPTQEGWWDRLFLPSTLTRTDFIGRRRTINNSGSQLLSTTANVEGYHGQWYRKLLKDQGENKNVCPFHSHQNSSINIIPAVSVTSQLEPNWKGTKRSKIVFSSLSSTKIPMFSATLVHFSSSLLRYW